MMTYILAHCIIPYFTIYLINDTFIRLLLYIVPEHLKLKYAIKLI